MKTSTYFLLGLLALFTLLPACRDTSHTRKFSGICSDPSWPHRYLIEDRGGKMAVFVEQRTTDGEGWVSWGEAVKTTEVTGKSIHFNCPWGVIGKALQINCVLRFDQMADAGFDAVLTVESFQDDKTRAVRFTRVSEDASPK